MKYTISDDRRTLTLICEDNEQQNIRTIREEEDPTWGTQQAECETLESLLCNSELDWVNPADTGDLTDAPMLGIIGGEEDETREESGPYGATHCGGDEGGAWFSPILERWAFTPYAVRSFLDDLADTGRAVFTS
jgi:hypothetical protein